MVPSKYLSNFLRTLEMPLSNCEINLILTWCDKFVLSNDTKATTFTITDTKLYLSAVTLCKAISTIKSCFKRTIDWNKYELKVSTEMPNPCLDFLINPSFQEINKLFVLSLENITVHTKYYLPTIELKDYNL